MGYVSTSQLIIIMFTAILITAMGAKAWASQQATRTSSVIVERQIPTPCQPVVQYRNPPRAPMWGHVGGAQVGTLSCDGRILPLFSSEHPTRRSRFNYHTLTDSNIPLRIAVKYKGRDCLNELGCEEIYDQETVQIPALGTDDWAVTLYQRY